MREDDSPWKSKFYSFFLNKQRNVQSFKFYIILSSLFHETLYRKEERENI